MATHRKHHVAFLCSQTNCGSIPHSIVMAFMGKLLLKWGTRNRGTGMRERNSLKGRTKNCPFYHVYLYTNEMATFFTLIVSTSGHSFLSFADYIRSKRSFLKISKLGNMTTAPHWQNQKHHLRLRLYYHIIAVTQLRHECFMRFLLLQLCKQCWKFFSMLHGLELLILFAQGPRSSLFLIVGIGNDLTINLALAISSFNVVTIVSRGLPLNPFSDLFW